MKNRYMPQWLIIVILSIATLLITCTKEPKIENPPVANFSATPLNGAAPLKVSFTDKSQNSPESWRWDFGDGITSTDQHPVHVYAAPGDYTVTLAASNACGTDKETKVDYVHLKNLPVANFSATPLNGAAPLEVSFTDESQNSPESWRWNFGDGTTSTDQHPVHVYAAPGDYTVILAVSNAFGTDMEVKGDYVHVESLPVADFSATPLNGNAPLEVSFTDESQNSPESWSWDFGDGFTSTEQHPVHVYIAPGDYTVILAASNAFGTDMEVKVDYVHVENLPVADFFATPLNGDAPLEVNFTDESQNSPESWNWDFGDGTTSTDQHPVHLYAAPGDYTVILSVSNAFGTDMETKVNYIHVENPACPFTVTDVDGNSYRTVLIGDHCWMQENLRVTHYPNGDAIPYITDNGAWAALEDNNMADAYCYYGDNPNTEYGALYSYAAAIADNWTRDNADGQGICPDGWHLPTDAEWKVLEGNVDTKYPVGGLVWDDEGWRGYDAGAHLKSTTGWNNGGNGDNSSGFTALASGYRGYGSGGSFFAGENGYWWLAEEVSDRRARYRRLFHENRTVYRYHYQMSSGFSVRCVRDQGLDNFQLR
ncbi:MAG: hypothetical protein CSA95_07190 [Bacteroidetes bacterium]|nr:MAG: hypothetical protein CSA95_07190 [Bacteroidota bacterium]